jgi:hypothetical protein
MAAVATADATDAVDEKVAQVMHGETLVYAQPRTTRKHRLRSILWVLMLPATVWVQLATFGPHAVVACLFTAAFGVVRSIRICPQSVEIDQHHVRFRTLFRTIECTWPEIESVRVEERRTTVRLTARRPRTLRIASRNNGTECGRVLEACHERLGHVGFEPVSAPERWNLSLWLPEFVFGLILPFALLAGAYAIRHAG